MKKARLLMGRAKQPACPAGGLPACSADIASFVPTNYKIDSHFCIIIHIHIF